LLVDYKDDPDSYADVDFLVEGIVDEVGDAKNKPHKVLVKWKVRRGPGVSCREVT
jgi:hypothetical protein